MKQLDIATLRQETPGCEQVLHFNNAGASLSPRIVIDTIKGYLDLESTIGGYEAEELKALEIKAFYQNIARLINCKPHEIAFAENATRAWDMAFYSLDFQPGDRILTAVNEYASNYLSFLHIARQRGAIIEVIPNDAYGQMDLNVLEKKLNSSVKLLAITHVPTQGGLINPAAEAGQLAKKHQVAYLLDATQSVGQMPIDVQQIQCDFLCGTGRKFLRGPRGTGFLYVSENIINRCNPPFIDLHSANWSSLNGYELMPDARRFETWEQNYAGKLGLSAAVRYALDLGVDAIWQRIQQLSSLFRNKLQTIPGLELQDLGKNQCGIITFTVKGKSPVEIKQALRKQRINVAVSVLEFARLDLEARGLDALVRASVHYYNTEEEIEVFCKVLGG
ncbi:selenocysteine lyase, PLP-dependent [Legionella birminghamensis]|uniref:Selenocysteine lyase, PLP-dependent n=1 Tax=Legionella birminghamensis TaxID=28083 RepID=A0A378I8L4_9GAMM|nr:aminotransferase class V-fold PLP-dependent enzyme [Legionella birminghamensis]KTC68316.1 selenocysteine lyase, PLP-dependent [Legionella birminghamensis]STX30971.1 selenocysteine lyase, PLP-dependent [Legionella birminghamensis]